MNKAWSVVISSTKNMLLILLWLIAIFFNGFLLIMLDVVNLNYNIEIYNHKWISFVSIFGLAALIISLFSLFGKKKFVFITTVIAVIVVVLYVFLSPNFQFIIPLQAQISHYNKQVLQCLADNNNKAQCFEKEINKIDNPKDAYNQLGQNYCRRQTSTLYAHCYYEWLALKENRNAAIIH